MRAERTDLGDGRARFKAKVAGAWWTLDAPAVVAAADFESFYNEDGELFVQPTVYQRSGSTLDVT